MGANYDPCLLTNPVTLEQVQADGSTKTIKPTQENYRTSEEIYKKGKVIDVAGGWNEDFIVDSEGYLRTSNAQGNRDISGQPVKEASNNSFHRVKVKFTLTAADPMIPADLEEQLPTEYDLTYYVNDVNREHTEVLSMASKRDQSVHTYDYGLERLTDEYDKINSQTTMDQYLYDGRGSVTQVINPNLDVKKQYRYDPFGSMTKGKPTVAQIYSYNGEEYNPTTDTQYLRARYYEPEIGKFITKDTYLGNPEKPLTRNLYSYTHNDPVNFDDPSGNDPPGYNTAAEDWYPDSDRAKNNPYADYSISQIQSRLNQLGWGGMNGEKLKVNGQMDFNTKYAVTCFQKAGGLFATGLINQQTTILLFSNQAPKRTSTGQNSSSGSGRSNQGSSGGTSKSPTTPTGSGQNPPPKSPVIYDPNYIENLGKKLKNDRVAVYYCNGQQAGMGGLSYADQIPVATYETNAYEKRLEIKSSIDEIRDISREPYNSETSQRIYDAEIKKRQSENELIYLNLSYRATTSIYGGTLSVGISIDLGAIFGVNICFQISTDSYGNISGEVSILGSKSTSLGSISATAYVTTTNASSVKKLEGTGYQLGGSVGEVLMVGLEEIMFEDSVTGQMYHGSSIQVGYTVGVLPAEMHGQVGTTYQKIFLGGD